MKQARQSAASLREALDELTEKLGPAADGDFSARLEAPVDDESVQRLAARLNEIMDAARTAADGSESVIEKEEAIRRLERQNQDLQHFAYVAGHDLQEPLRMVSSFLQLLQRRYKGKIDESADEYIDFAVDGARRMQILIRDLLAYSRIETQARPFEEVYLGDVVRTVTRDLEPTIEEASGEVLLGEMPVVRGDEVQLRQLFQNLIGNGLKFRSNRPPQVTVEARQEPGRWIISVSDNGIGIEMRYADRIFELFQRLHQRDEYEGTGIGLALCKRIVERHGGDIWFESVPGEGTTFYFTLPDQSV
jgi:light-regulated signal transduction histidine kinase (bacteriophytochrome)